MFFFMRHDFFSKTKIYKTHGKHDFCLKQIVYLSFIRYYLFKRLWIQCNKLSLHFVDICVIYVSVCKHRAGFIFIIIIIRLPFLFPRVSDIIQTDIIIFVESLQCIVHGPVYKQQNCIPVLFY